MNEAVKKFMDALQKEKLAGDAVRALVDWQGSPEHEKYQELIGVAEALWNEEICTSPEAAYILLDAMLEANDQGKTQSYAKLVDYIREEDLQNIFNKCLPALLLDYEKADESLKKLEYDCLGRIQWQFPHFFVPYLNAMAVYGSEFREAWWDAGNHGFVILIGNICETKITNKYIYDGMVERTNCEAAFEWLRINRSETCLHKAGFCYSNGGWVRLYPEQAYHLVFPSEYINHPDWSSHRKPTHPTWHLKAEFGSAHFYSRSIPKWLTDAPEYRFDIRELPPLINATLPIIIDAPQDSGPVEYRYDENGIEIGIHEDWDEEVDGPLVDPFESVPFIPIAFAPTPKRWYRQPDENEQNLSRLGGPGVWRQFTGEYGGQCAECGEHETLLFQIADDSLRSQFWISSVNWCDRCRIATVTSTYC